MVIHLGFKELLISKSIQTFDRLFSNASYSEMDLENKMTNKAQGLLLIASSAQVQHKGYAKKKKYVFRLLCM
jgi:hypothetical protein